MLIAGYWAGWSVWLGWVAARTAAGHIVHLLLVPFPSLRAPLAAASHHAPGPPLAHLLAPAWLLPPLPLLLPQDPSLVPGYDGSLLRLSVDLTDRFMPAFETPTGIPLSWVNLRHVCGGPGLPDDAR